MNKFRITFYNRFACENQTFNVLAKDEEDAERLFWLRYDKKSYHEDIIEHIQEITIEHFYSEDEIVEIVNMMK